jgi:hypothetical protein
MNSVTQYVVTSKEATEILIGNYCLYQHHRYWNNCCFWILPIILFLFIEEHTFGDWTLSPSSSQPTWTQGGKGLQVKPTMFSLDRTSPYLAPSIGPNWRRGQNQVFNMLCAFKSIQTGWWLMFRNTIIALLYYHNKFSYLNYFLSWNIKSIQETNLCNFFPPA